MSDPCFTLRINLYKDDKRLIIIRAYDDMVPQWDSAGRIRLTCEVRHGGQLIFPKGQLTCALHAASDSIKAKELILSLVAMAPAARGGEGEGYYSDYTAEQLDWVNTHWEELSMEREARYCSKDGSVKG